MMNRARGSGPPGVPAGGSPLLGGSAYHYAQVPEDEAAEGGTAGTPARRPGASSNRSPGSISSPGLETPPPTVGEFPVHGEVLRKVATRRTTDVCSLCAFILYWVGMCAIAVSSLRKGDPRRLYHSFDYSGRLCGVDSGVEGKQLAYWPRPESPDYPVCVERCPADGLQTVLFLQEEASVTHDANGAEKVTIKSREIRLPTYPSRQVGSRLCLPTALADAFDRPRRSHMATAARDVGSTTMLSTFPDLDAVKAISSPPEKQMLTTEALTSLAPSAEMQTSTTELQAQTMSSGEDVSPTSGFPDMPGLDLQASAEPEGGGVSQDAVDAMKEDESGLSTTAFMMPAQLGPSMPEIDQVQGVEAATSTVPPLLQHGAGYGVDYPEPGSGAMDNQLGAAMPAYHGVDAAEGSQDLEEDDAFHGVDAVQGSQDVDEDDAFNGMDAAQGSQDVDEDDAFNGMDAAQGSQDLDEDDAFNGVDAAQGSQDLDEDDAFNGMEAAEGSQDLDEDDADDEDDAGRRRRRRRRRRKSDDSEEGRRMSINPRSDNTTEKANSLVVYHLTALLEGQAKSPGAQLRKVVWDIGNAWTIVVLLGGILSAASGFMYLLFMKYCARPFSFGILGLLILASISMSVYCLAYVGDDEDKADDLFGTYSEHPETLARIIGWSCVGLDVVLFGLLCAFFPTMRRAVGCIDSACDAIWAHRPLLRMPALEVGVKTIYTLIWLALFSFVASSGEIAPPTLEVNGTPVSSRIRRFSSSPQQKFFVIYYIAGYIWGLETIGMLFHFAVSFCAVTWYFTPCRADGSKTELEPQLWRTGMLYALRYHLGSLALGAAVTAIFRPVHAPMAIIAKQARYLERHANPLVVAHCMCCVWCFEEVVRYIDKNAVIYMVLNSSGYFNSAGSAVRLLAKAGQEVSYVNGITGGLHSLGMLATACLAAYLSFVVLGDCSLFAEPSSIFYVENRVAVVFAVGLLAAGVSSCFMALFDVVFDTLLFCWLADDKEGHVRFVPDSLKGVLGDPKGRVCAPDAESDPETGGQQPGTARTTARGPHEEGGQGQTAAATSSRQGGQANRTTGPQTQQVARGETAQQIRQTPQSAGQSSQQPARAAAEQEAAAQRAKEQEAASRKAREQEAAARKAAEQEASQTAAEEAAARKAKAEAARKAAEEAAAQKAAEEAAARKAAEEAAAQKAREEAAARKAAEEAAASKAAEEAAARKAAEEAAARKAAEEAAARKAAEEAAARKAAEEAAARKAAEEAATRKAVEEAAARKAAEEASVRKAAEEAAARKAAEEAAASKAAEEAAARKAAEEAAARKAAEEAAARKAAEEAATRKAAEEAAARKAAEEAAAQKAAEEAAARKASEEAAARKAAEEAAARKAAEEAATREAAEEAAAWRVEKETPAHKAEELLLQSTEISAHTAAEENATSNAVETASTRDQTGLPAASRPAATQESEDPFVAAGLADPFKAAEQSDLFKTAEGANPFGSAEQAASPAAPSAEDWFADFSSAPAASSAAVPEGDAPGGNAPAA